jgi:copper chaperone
MPEPTKHLLMRVEGLSCQGCVETITRAVRRVDPGATLEADLEHGRVRVTTRAQSLEVAAAISAAGYEATAMTG